MSIADILAAKKAEDKLPPVSPDRLASYEENSTYVEPQKKEASPIVANLVTANDLKYQMEMDRLQADIKNTSLSIIKRIKARQELAALLTKMNTETEEQLNLPKRLEKTLEMPKLIEIKESPKFAPELTKEEIEADKKKTFSLFIELNEKQLEAANLAEKKVTFVLTGAAGTGKTTAAREIAKRLLSQGALGTHNFKVKTSTGSTYENGPSIAFVAYTRRATNNMRKALHMDPVLEEKLRYNVLTIHSLLEFEPVSFTTEAGNESMRFEPTRHENNKLRITHLVIEEASMLGTNLGKKLLDACEDGVQIIYMGDINQLQPVMDKPMLSYALIKLPVIELDKVYRQALDSDIIKGAHHILKGEHKEFMDMVNSSSKKQVRIAGKAMVHTEETIVQALGNSFQVYHEKGIYDPMQDMILSPFNKNALGTININNWIAQFLGTKRKAIVYEVLAGREKHYLAVGDKVMYDKRDGIITKISLNGNYIGKMYKPHSEFLSRFGVPIIGGKAEKEQTEDEMFVGYDKLNIDEPPEEEKKKEASHVVEIEYDDGTKDVLNAVGDFAPQMFSLGYALTVHKAQGCEWRKVYLIMHKNHATMLSRELFYTAATRAKEELQIIATETTIRKAITAARIKGQSLAEKIEYFNSGALDASTIQVSK